MPFMSVFGSFTSIRFKSNEKIFAATHMLNGFRLKPDAFVFDLRLPGNIMFKN